MHILRCTEGDRQWRAIQSWNCFKRVTKKRQNYNSDKLLSFVDEKISCALAHKTPDDSFTTSTWGLLLRATLKMFLA